MKISILLLAAALLLGCNPTTENTTPSDSLALNEANTLPDSDPIVAQPITDTIMVANLNNCLAFFEKYKHYPDEYFETLHLLDNPTPYHTLQYVGKTTSASFFIVYAYTIEAEEGWINLLLADSVGNVLDKRNVRQIYQTLNTKKQSDSVFRIYGKNPKESNGSSDNLQNTGQSSNYDYDFYVTISPTDSILIAQ